MKKLKKDDGEDKGEDEGSQHDVRPLYLIVDVGVNETLGPQLKLYL